METATITTATINLDQFLKWVGVVDTGGQTKILLDNQQIRVNKVVATERRKKLRPGDIVEIQGFGSWKIIAEHDEA